VLVDVVGGDEQLAKDLAMHIAASKPKSLDSSGVPAELLDMERRIAIEKAREAGKPEAMLEKIAEGTVQKYLKDVTLLGQVFVKAEDGKQTIEQLLKAKGASVAELHAVHRRRGHREEGQRLRRRGGRAGGRCRGQQVRVPRPWPYRSSPHPAQAVGRGADGR
jgi:translation elongation factor EF-Ts